MRRLGSIAAMLIITLMLAPPVLAQSASGSPSPSASASSSASAQDQYDSDAASAVADGIQDVAGTTAQGADAVNDALSGAESSTGLDALPETGGPSLTALLAGAFLVGLGLMVRRGFRG